MLATLIPLLSFSTFSRAKIFQKIARFSLNLPSRTSSFNFLTVFKGIQIIYCYNDFDKHVSISRMISSVHLRFSKPVVRRFLSSMAGKDLHLSKKIAGEKAVAEREFKGNMVIGIGSGSTVVYVARCIAETIENIKCQAIKDGKSCDLNVVCVPSSFQARQLILENNLTLGSLDSHPEVDWTIDGADEVDEENNIIKGGGGCLTQEKILASCSKDFYIAGDYTKYSKKLGTVWKGGIPIEVIPVSYVAIKKKIEKQFGGEAVLRMAVKKAGPIITDNNNFILDWKFPECTCDWVVLETVIKMMPGVVETGLFLKMATKIYIGSAEGDVKIYSPGKE